MKTLSQISEDLYDTETALLRDDITIYEAARELCQIRYDLELHIVAPHDTPGGGIMYSLDASPPTE